MWPVVELLRLQHTVQEAQLPTERAKGRDYWKVSMIGDAPIMSESLDAPMHVG